MEPGRPPIRRVLLIVNPGSRRAARLHHRATAALRARGVEVAVRLTERPGHGRELATRMGTFDAVFSLGGDGTAMELAGALAGRGIPLGVLAGGTGNLLARALGIPLNVRKAVDRLLDGRVLACDLGCLPAAGFRFAVAAGVGIDARMVALTPPWLKRRAGVLAYWLTAAHAAFGSVLGREGRFHVRLTVDGQVEEREAVMAMVANFGAVLDDVITFGPGIKYDDGVLDAVVYSPRTLWDAVVIMWRLMRKDFRSSPHVLYRSGRHIRIETTPPQPVQADGELLGPIPFEVITEPRAALLLIPSR